MSRSDINISSTHVPKNLLLVASLLAPQVQVKEALVTIKSATYSNGFDFQEAVHTLLTSLLDAHTWYKKPSCYAATYVLSVAFGLVIPESVTASGVVEQEPEAAFIQSTFYDEYSTLFPDIDLSPLFKATISLINGLEWQTAVHD